MKVAIAFIGTGRYLNFLPQYYEHIEENFLPNTEKTILAFTDGEMEGLPDNVKVYPQEHLEWPFITLKRFEIINKAREEILKNDWFVFIDADAFVVGKVTEEEFLERCCGATTDEVPLFGVHHPCHRAGMPPHKTKTGAYETDEKSEAYFDVSKELPPIYWQGCFWGGKVPPVLAMIDEIEGRVNRDLENDIVALWHDETHINKYFHEREFDVHTFGIEYAYPQLFQMEEYWMEVLEEEYRDPEIIKKLVIGDGSMNTGDDSAIPVMEYPAKILHLAKNNHILQEGGSKLDRSKGALLKK